jgi:hypothetical protein
LFFRGNAAGKLITSADVDWALTLSIQRAIA